MSISNMSVSSGGSGGTHKSKFGIHSSRKERSFIQRTAKGARSINFDTQTVNSVPSLKDINHDSIVANKTMIEGYILNSKVPPYIPPTLVTRYRGIDIYDKKKVLIKYSPYSLDTTSPLSKFLNEWYLLSGSHPKIKGKEDFMDNVSNFSATVPLTLPRDIPGVLYPKSFIYSEQSGGSGLVYDNERNLINFKEKFILGVKESPNFLSERSPSSSSIKSLSSNYVLDLSKKTRPRSSAEVVEILQAIVEILKVLKRVHDLGFTNNGLTTACLYVSEKNEYFIEGWDFAFALSMENCANGYRVTNKDLVSSLLAYTSPEATGRFNKLCDFRSDFYSIGVIMYELLVGFLPFQSSDASRRIQAHLFTPPVAPYVITSWIPESLSDVMMRCLSKLATDRYNDCNHLINSLLNCIDEVSDVALPRDPNYPYPTIPRFINPKNAYNRQQDLDSLIKVYNEAQSGISHIYIIGQQGAGKSSILNDFKAHLIGKGNILYADWCHEKFRNSDSTYRIFTTLIRQVLQQIISSGPKAMKKWRPLITNKVDDDLDTAMIIFPEIKQFIGAKAIKLSKEETPQFSTESHLVMLPTKFESKFEYIVKRFFLIFSAYAAEGLTIILDDDQFQHHREREIFEEIRRYILTHAHSKVSPKLRIVSTLLDGEGEKGVYKSFPTLKTIDSVRAQKDAKIINLSPLTFDSVKTYLADYLPSAHFPNQDHINRLFYDKYLFDKSPLVLRMALIKFTMKNAFLVKGGKAIFDYQDWMKTPPKSLSEYYKDLFNLFEGSNTAEILKFAACICLGNNFSLYHLSTVSGLSIADTYLALYAAVATSFIQPLGIDYKIPFHLLNSDPVMKQLPRDRLIHLASTCQFTFAHDSLQDFLLSQVMGPETCQKYHQTCGLRLYDIIENLEDLNYARLIYVTRHFVESVDVASSEESSIYADVLVSGGKLAYDNYDFQLALFYFQHAKRFIDADIDNEERQISTKKVDFTIVHLMYVIGEYEEAIKAIDELVECYQSTTDKVAFYLTKIKAMFKLNQNDEAIDMGLKCLQMLGYDFERGQEWNEGYVSKLRPRIPLSVTEIRNLAKDLANIESMDDMILPELISTIIIPIMASQTRKSKYLVTSLLYAGVIDGIDNGFAPSHAMILLIMTVLLFRDERTPSFMRAVEYTNVALKITEDSNTPVEMGTSIYEIYCCTMAIYSQPFASVSKYYDVFIASKRLVTGTYVELGSFLFAGLKNTLRVFSGTENLNSILLKISKAETDHVAAANTTLSMDWAHLNTTSLKCIIGSLPFQEFSIDQVVERHGFQDEEYKYCYYVMKFYVAYFTGEPEIALQILFETLPDYDALFPITCFSFPVAYIACLLLLTHPGETPEIMEQRSTKLALFRNYMDTWSGSCPENFEIKNLLIKAVVHSKSKESIYSNVDILDMFEDVIEKAGAKNQLLDEAIACEMCSVWLLETSKGKARASKLMKEAIRLYNLWGSSAKNSKLSEEYHELVHDYNWAGVDILSPSSEQTSSPMNPTAPFHLLLSNFFRADQAVQTSSDDDNINEIVEEAGPLAGGHIMNGSDLDTTILRRSSSESSAVDMKAALRTCLEISESVDKSTILTKLIECTMTLVDGDFALIALQEKGDLYLECAMVNGRINIMKHEPLNSQSDVCPVTLIRDSFTKGVVINREDDPILFDNRYMEADYYFQTNPASGILCLPIKDQNEVIGVIYMESQNNSRSKAKLFNAEKIDIATLFSTQAAFSLYKATLYQQMNVATNAARAATEEKANFLNSMSHEIRTPFNSLLSCALFLLDTELTEVQRDYVETIKSSSMVTLSIIDGILSFAKIENSFMSLDNLPFSVNECIESAMQLVCEQVSSKNLELVFLNDCKELNNIFGDITRFRQVIVNIVGNAVKFTTQGHILITAKCHRVSSDDRYDLTITVKDTGIGIPKDSNNKVFGAFSQVDGSARRVYGGAGLGLAISKKIVDLMGGSLTFDSEENKGTTFTFSLIVKAEVNTQPIKQVGKGKKIYICDHHNLSRYALEKEVRSYGYGVVSKKTLKDVSDDFKEPFEVAFIHRDLLQAYDELKVNKLMKKYPKTKFVMIGPFGTVHKKKFDRILLLPFQRAKVFELLSAEQSKTMVKGSTQPLTKESMSTLAETHPLKILLAEDNMINTKVTLQHLKKMGYEADHASDGLIAVEKCLEHVKKYSKNYDVILMDIQMPRMDGIEACTKIFEIYGEESRLRPQVIALTANVIGEDRQRCIACGMSNFIPKPLLPNDLAQALIRASPKN